MGLAEMTGSPNLTVVPDLSTFRVLPWAPRVGWVLCDEYFTSGVPFHFSTRQLLRKQRRAAGGHGPRLRRRPGIEWYLLCVAQGPPRRRERRHSRHAPAPGQVYACGAGLFLSLRINMDLMQPVLSGAGRGLRADRAAAAVDRERVGAGPARVHLRGTAGAGSRRPRVLVPRRHAPDLPPDGLLRHLHVPARRTGATIQRLAPSSVLGRCQERAQRIHAGARARMFCRRSDEAYLGGLLKHAAASAAFAILTINGYRRYEPNSLAPDRATWCYDHRGVMLRVRRAGRRHHPDREPDRRARGQPLPLHPCRRSSPASTASRTSSIPARRTTSPTPPTGPGCPRACPAALGGARARAAVPRYSSGGIHRLFPQAQAQRGGALCAMAQGRRLCRKATSRRIGSRGSISISFEEYAK